MKENLLIFLVFLFGLGVGFLESIWLFFWLWLVFLPLIWRLNLKVEGWWFLAFFLGLVRDLFLGGNLGKSSFLFLIVVFLFSKLIENYRPPKNLLS